MLRFGVNWIYDGFRSTGGGGGIFGIEPLRGVVDGVETTNERGKLVGVVKQAWSVRLSPLSHASTGSVHRVSQPNQRHFSIEPKA